MCNCAAIIKAIDAYLKKAEDDLKDELEAAGFASADKTMDAINALEDGVAAALVEETELFTSAAAEVEDLQAFAENIWPKVKQNDALSKKLKTVFADGLSDLVPDLVENYIKRSDKELSIPRISKLTTAWIEEWSGELADLMQLNSQTEIERILEDGLANGDSIAVFTQNILDSGIRDEYYKARRVSVTEVLRAHNVAQQEAFMQSPSVTMKMWRHTGSYRNQPRENHVAMDGQTVGKADAFELRGARLEKGEYIYTGEVFHPMYPLDPVLPAAESINCHCICEPVVDADILGLTLEERQALQQQAIDEMDDSWEAELDAKNRARAGIE